MLMTIGLLSFVGMIVFAVMSFRSWATKNGKMKKNLLITGSCFVLMSICASLDSTPVEEQQATKEDVKEVAVSKEVTKEAEEEETQQEAEDKAQAEEEAKAIAASEAEEKKKAGLAKQEAAKIKAEEDKKKQAEKAAQQAKSEEQMIETFQQIIEVSEGVIIDIRQSPYGVLDWQQMQVIISDAWYNSPEHEKERFAESVSAAVESAIYESGIVKTDQTILTDFLDSYDKELATEKIFGGYKIKR